MNSMDHRYAHATADGPVRVAWVDKRGQVHRMPGWCIDVSDVRIHLEVPQQIPLQTHVTLSACRKRIPGPNAVKCLTKCGKKFILVLE